MANENIEKILKNKEKQIKEREDKLRRLKATSTTKLDEVQLDLAYEIGFETALEYILKRINGITGGDKSGS